MAYIAVACIVLAYVVVAYKVVAYIVVAYIAIANAAGMACIATAYVGMAHAVVPASTRLHVDGIDSRLVVDGYTSRLSGIPTRKCNGVRADMRACMGIDIFIYRHEHWRRYIYRHIYI